jgi:uncharacterized repeat protein (TIGR03806 family)
LFACLSGLLAGGGLLVLLACGGGSPAPDGGTPEAPFGLTERTPLAPLAFPDTAPNPSDVGLTNAFPSLSFSQRPIFATASGDGTNWIYVAEQEGRIHVFPNDPAVTSTATFLDLRPLVAGPLSTGSNEEGLLGLAFDPEYATNGYFYVHYTSLTPSRRNVLQRYTATFPVGAAPTVNAASALTILEVPQPYSNHNAGMIAFGPDDMLYVSYGDGGLGNDPDGNGQDPTTLLGSMLRIDVRAASVATPYTVPSDNPYFGHATNRPEIWAIGLRNPWRFSFDRDTGDLWLGDVGQGAREEIDIIVREGNYGWPVYEGFRSNLNPGGLPATDFDQPVLDYPRTIGITVVGGYVYRGQDVTTLRGAYLYGDYGSGRIFAAVRLSDGTVSTTELPSLSGLSSFGEDERGELFAVSLGGTIHRFTEPPGTPAPVLPPTLSATGLFQDVASLTPAPGMIEYDVNAPVWADGAHTRRFIGIPGLDRIAFQPTGAWNFPLGTVLVKHRDLELEVGVPSSARRIETRVLLRQRDGWLGLSYRWNDAQTDADLLPGGLLEDFEITDAAAQGGMRTQTWEYPSRTDCLRCHTEAAGRVLGVRTEQLNRAFDYPALTDNQLRSWNHIGLFHGDIGSASNYMAWPNPHDSAQPVEGRARAYLASNCAQCHRPGGPAPTNSDMRFSTPTDQMNLVGFLPTLGNLGLPSPRVIDPGDRDNSVLWLRMGRLDSFRMPPVGSRHVDASGREVIGAWIDALPR